MEMNYSIDYNKPKVKKTKRQPTHLFTFDEFSDVINKIDNHNRSIVVIDYDGFVDVTYESPYYAEANYAVRLEMWQPGNAPVYCKRGIRDAYVVALYGWLLYLSSGEHIWADVSLESDVDKLIDELTSFY